MPEMPELSAEYSFDWTSVDYLSNNFLLAEKEGFKFVKAVKFDDKNNSFTAIMKRHRSYAFMVWAENE